MATDHCPNDARKRTEAAVASSVLFPSGAQKAAPVTQSQVMTRRRLNIQPALTEWPGLPVRIITNRDLVLRPSQALFFNKGPSR